MEFEENYVMISALQHLLFCKRQCALIHVAQEWADNRLTVQGELLHATADSGYDEKRSDLFIARSVQIKSVKYKISGKADVIEFYKTGSNGIELPNQGGHWRPIPVEYKRGKPKSDDSDHVQLCAQALCFEEMFKTTISEGAMFYHAIRRREFVLIDAALRSKTIELIEILHNLIKIGEIPSARYSSKCKNCSLLDICRPEIKNSMAAQYYRSLFIPEVS
ncbi:MAG: CRISPR-associated protein Cas4 [Chitinivibrionales bacterium]|nr:CRISPR-associated protein Cas4 [Chitinivibrionales bacterium]